MHETALFVGWGKTHPGRETFALKHFAEWEKILARLQEEKEIAEFETILLGPHGGELEGFTLVYGTFEKLAALQIRKEIEILRAKVALDHAYFTVIPAITGEALERQLSLFREAIAEHEREPVLV